jgi:hypothetical protein
MTTLLFYKKLIGIDREAHRTTLFKMMENDHEYAKSHYSFPLAVVEFGQASLEYPIVFAMDGEGGGMPMAITGLRENENLFVSENKKWDAAYIPAFVRRYPFLPQVNENGNDFVLLVDEEFPGFGTPDGERLFTDDGNPSSLLTQTMEFLAEFHNQEKQSASFVAKLKELDLLIPQSIDITLKDSASLTLHGFFIIDHDRLRALPDATILELARNGDLAQIYAHLISLGNLQKLVIRLEQKMAT